MAEIEERFKNFVGKIGEISNLLLKNMGDTAPDLIKMSLKANLLVGAKKYTLSLSPQGADFMEGYDRFTDLLIIANDQFWQDVFDGKYSFFGGYTRGLVEIPNFRPHRYKIFFISGMLAILQSLNIQF